MRRLISLILALCAVTALGALDVSAEPALSLPPFSEPYTQRDDSLSTGLVTEWDCVTFGTYPQTEIVPAAFTAVDDYALAEGDVLEDPALYETLAQADWEGNETRIDGVRYLRMNRHDAAHSSPDSAGHYRWGADDEWHYFRFDPIRWRVIGLEEDKAFLMADRLLDCMPYHPEAGPVTWETSAVRSWLNGLSGEENSAGIDYRGKGFADTAFSEKEREALLAVRVRNRPNSRYGTDCGRDTEDFVFLLSNDEVFESESASRHGFFASTEKDDPAKRFRSTLYAKCRGAWWSSVNGYRGNSFWFMRTNGYTRESVTYICDFGYIYERGTIATCEDAGILPALWIDLNKARPDPDGTVSSREIQENARAYSPENQSGKDQIVNPFVEPDPSEPDGKKVTYSLVRFGSYPQSEILPDSDLYAALEQAEWEKDECVYEGKRYLRTYAAAEKGNSIPRYFACEPLLWRALEIRDGTALLLSNTAIDCEPFQADLREVSWEDCTLRSWLNGYSGEANASGIDYSGERDNFPDKAFSPEEQGAILETAVRNESNYYFGMDSGNATTDRIFLPAESELFIFDSSKIHGFSPRDEIPDRCRQFTPTDYAVMKGAWRDPHDENGGNVFWITRTTGYTHSNVVYVDEDGYIYNRGILVTCSDAAVIPALVIDLDTSVYEYAGTLTIGSQ